MELSYCAIEMGPASTLFACPTPPRLHTLSDGEAPGPVAVRHTPDTLH